MTDARNQLARTFAALPRNTVERNIAIARIGKWVEAQASKPLSRLTRRELAGWLVAWLGTDKVEELWRFACDSHAEAVIRAKHAD